MKPVLVYSGTTEGKRLSGCLSAAEIPCTVCVATEYGELVMPELAHVTLHRGRMTTEEMRIFCKEGGYQAVVDATHPFAVEVSANIRKSLEGSEIPYLRLKRDEESQITHPSPSGNEHWFSTAQACADVLKEVEGNILLTTGSKELSVYAEDETVRKRLYVRVLPSVESIRLCEEQGIAGKQILAMQGPFTEELNKAILKQYKIACLVTKQSGAAGGFPEKRHAAGALGIPCYIIGSPKEEGLSFSEVLDSLEILTGKMIKPVSKNSKDPRSVGGNSGIQVTLAGIGMGSIGTVTEDVKQAVEKADVLFGAERILDAVRTAIPTASVKRTFPYYQAEDILPELIRLENENRMQTLYAVVVFSGDTGFYSGCRKMQKGLIDAGIEKVRICPGISCISYLSAAAGIAWQDAKIISIHGHKAEENWKGRLSEEIRYHENVFVLVSGAEDIREIGELLESEDQRNCRIIVGYQLSYPEESIRTYTPSECQTVTKKGLYVCLIENPYPQQKPVTHGWKDDRFMRGQVPMTKEEVREICISKLGLTEQAVVYDIGSGTGSIAVEIAARSSSIHVYAIEQKSEAAELIRVNCEKFHLHNVTLVTGTAPETLFPLPDPTHVFIGGSGGALKEILCTLSEKNQRIRIVMTAVTLETISELSHIFREIPVSDEEIIQIQVSRSRQVGSYHMMQAENPVYVVSFSLN